MAACVFCAIATGELPAHIIYADAETLGFLDRRPAARGHGLVIPRRHVENLWDATASDAAAVGAAVHAVAGLLRARLGPDGLTMRQNTGTASGQDVFHLHVHLVPRWHGDGHIGWPTPGQHAQSPAEIAELLRD